MSDLRHQRWTEKAAGALERRKANPMTNNSVELQDAIERTPYCPNCGEACLDSWHSPAIAALSTLTDEVAALKAALVDHNDRLRSCCQVADRDGRDTNWKALRGQIHYTLAEHHEITNEARTSMEGQPHEGAKG